MNPYQIMAIIACCTLIFAGVVTFLTLQGVPILVAFLGVYLTAIWFMLGMQRRAQQAFDGRRKLQRRTDRENSVATRVATTDDSNAELDVEPQRSLPV
jgi:uncharacterized membrane protein